MLSNKLFLIASLGLVALTNAQQTSTFQFKDTYPEPFKVPQPKQEWLDLIANASIADAPLLKTDANGGKNHIHHLLNVYVADIVFLI